MLKELETKSQEEIQREKATAKMFDAIERLDYEAVKAAIAEGADVNARYCEETPLHAMLDRGDGWSSHGLIQLLFEKGADPYDVTDEGDTPLHYAAMYFRKNDIPCILEYGGPGLKRVRGGNDGKTAYEIAKRWGEHALEALETKALIPRKLRLVTLDVDINEIIDPMTGWTSLHEAAAICEHEAFDGLLANGADPTIRDNNGVTPYELAERTINEVLELLKPEPLPWLKRTV
ncbi:MAG: ankyrin repeat domain-containing protein [bacterium]|nr:ankyrin repeat domain-containing protein [bacterium]